MTILELINLLDSVGNKQAEVQVEVSLGNGLYVGAKPTGVDFDDTGETTEDGAPVLVIFSTEDK